jgi:hypothetical protein
MPVVCKLPQYADPIYVGTVAECERLGGFVEQDNTSSLCFVRNVLTRTLGSLILDVGRAPAVSVGIRDSLVIPSPKGRRTAKRKPGRIKMTPGRQRTLASQAARAILELARTYDTTVQFRDRLLLTTARGKQLKHLYDTHLGEIFDVTHGDPDLMNAAGSTWFAVYPFVKAMVDAAPPTDDAASKPKRQRKAKRSVVFSTQQHKACVELIHSYRDASSNSAFRQVLAELEGELAAYVRLSAEESVARLQATPAKAAPKA